MEPKLIKTETDYENALARIDKLMDAEPGTPGLDELEVLSTLVELYEEREFPIGLPDPIDAIKFRMDQSGLKAKDLVPYIGSASKVSEVLKGTRPLTLSMIRALHENFDIPADVLLQEPGARLPEKSGLDPSRIPWGEMLKRGWLPGFNGTVSEAKDRGEELLREFLPDMQSDNMVATLFRRHVREGAEMDTYALLAWTARVTNMSQEKRLGVRYEPGTIDHDFMRRLVGLSYLEDGPKLAREFLNKNGIHMIVERHLPKTHVDGASSILDDGTPLVALTIRHDRLDNFWFCLCHELGHIKLHLGNTGINWFVDDLDVRDGKEEEVAADNWAEEALIPPEIWEDLGESVSGKDVLTIADRLKVHPAIVAGRIRWETKNFRRFARMVGYGQVRKHFPEVEWN